MQEEFDRNFVEEMKSEGIDFYHQAKAMILSSEKGLEIRVPTSAFSVEFWMDLEKELKADEAPVKMVLEHDGPEIIVILSK